MHLLVPTLLLWLQVLSLLCIAKTHRCWVIIGLIFRCQFLTNLLMEWVNRFRFAHLVEVLKVYLMSLNRVEVGRCLLHTLLHAVIQLRWRVNPVVGNSGLWRILVWADWWAFVLQFLNIHNFLELFVYSGVLELLCVSVLTVQVL